MLQSLFARLESVPSTSAAKPYHRMIIWTILLTALIFVVYAVVRSILYIAKRYAASRKTTPGQAERGLQPSQQLEQPRISLQGRVRPKSVFRPGSAIFVKVQLDRAFCPGSPVKTSSSSYCSSITAVPIVSPVAVSWYRPTDASTPTPPPAYTPSWPPGYNTSITHFSSFLRQSETRQTACHVGTSQHSAPLFPKARTSAQLSLEQHKSKYPDGDKYDKQGMGRFFICNRVDPDKVGQ